ncbi:uncharacterized mitochondrial protein-like protein [Tanacetum coccineum]
MVPRAVLMKSGLVSINTARQNISKTAVSVNSVRQGNPQMDLQDQGVIDSGCSRHMTGNMSYLTNYEEIDGGYVAFGGNPKGGKITRKCTIKTGNLDFENVYFVRELKFNLFSISQMYDKKNSVLFNDTECIVLSPNFKLIDESQVLLRVPRKNNMYSVDLKNIVPKGGLTCLFAKATSDESKLWHRRLGHLNFKTMNKLVKGNLVRGLPSKLFENDQTCVACQKGKQHRASSTKDETSGILKSFITGIENLVDHKVKAEAVNTACYVQNRVLVVKPHNKTPYKLFHGITPTLSFMRPFGCLVTILNTIDDLGKFDGKADVGSRPDWLFDIDALTRIRNYEPIVAGTQSNGFVGTKASDNEGQARKETKPIKDYILLPLWTADLLYSQYPKSSHDDGSKPSSDNGKKVNEDPRRDSECNDQEKKDNVNSTNTVNVVGINEEEPKKVIHALKDPSWIEAMQEELIQFKLQEVWTLVDLPNGKRAIGTKWVFKNKKDERCEKIEEEVYVCQPPGFEDPDFLDRVYKVEKALYGLHQAPRAWYETLSTYLLDNGFQRGKIDKTLFIKRHKGDILLVQVYVDDIIFGSTKKELCNAFEKLMHEKFQMSSMGELTFFLGLQVQQKKDGIFISQDKYVVEILKKFRFTEVKTTSTLMETQKPLLKDEDGEEVDVHMYSSKTDAWNKFCSTMASAIICLATNHKFNFSKYIFESMVRNLDSVFWEIFDASKVCASISGTTTDDMSTHKRIYIAPSHTKKIFRNMRRVGKGFPRRVTPLFPTMVVQNQQEFGEGSIIPTDPHHTPTITQPSTSQPQKTQKPRKPKRKDTRVPQPSGLTDIVADEVIHKELGDSLVRVATTASSLEAEQDSGNITKTQSKATPNESSSRGTTSGGGPRCQETMGDTIAQTRFENISKLSNDSLLTRGNTLRSDKDSLKLKELMELCTNLQQRVLDLEKTKTTQQNEIANRVESSRDEESLGEDASKQGMINAIDADEDITLVNVQDDADNEMFDVNVLNDEDVFVAGQNENVVEEVVDAIQISTAATTVTITTEEITLAQALEALKTSKPKVKGIVFQKPSTTTTITTISSQQSQDKLNLMKKKDLREKAEKKKKANIALIEE